MPSARAAFETLPPQSHPIERRDDLVGICGFGENTSRLTDEPDEGVGDIHTHPALPRSAWFGVQVSF